MFDLFISYSSHDRPWAARLYADLRERFPTLRIFWDRDPVAIPPAEGWAQRLKDSARTSTHLAVLWSEAKRR
jgi:hypothetical protein